MNNYKLSPGNLFILFALVLCFSTTGYADSLLTWGQMKTPDSPLTNITAIAAGSGHSLGLKSDGSIVGWGKKILETDADALIAAAQQIIELLSDE